MQIFFIVAMILLSHITIAVDQNDEERPAKVLELTPQNNSVTLGENEENTRRFRNFSLPQLRFPSNRFSYDSLQDDSVVNGAKVGCAGFCGLGIVAAIISCSILYQPYRTHVENQTKDTIVLRYSNNCSYKDSKGNTHSQECTKTLYPKDTTTIISSGHLSNLCATNQWGFGRECTTYHALQDCSKFKVTKGHGHYTFTRLCGNNDGSKNLNVTESLVKRMFDLEEEDRVRKYTNCNLRGSNSKIN
ncbi:MAG: hypothetical protein ACXWL2_02030 [Candidatus Chromulinivorax sp.]